MSWLSRICRSCGRSFEGGPRAWYCPICRQERAKQQSRDYKFRKSRGLSRKIGETYICGQCGCSYILSGGLQRFCERCAPLHLKTIDNAQSRAWNAAHPNEILRSKDSERTKQQAVVASVNASSYLLADLSLIKTLRVDLGLSQDALADKSGVSPQTLRSYELSRKANPSLLKLECIAAGLGMTTRDFFRVLYGDSTAKYRGSGCPPKRHGADLSRIELLRSRKGVTAHGLSTMAGLDTKLVATLERSEQNDVKLTTLERLASALDMRPIDLLLYLYD